MRPFAVNGQPVVDGASPSFNWQRFGSITAIDHSFGPRELFKGMRTSAVSPSITQQLFLAVTHNLVGHSCNPPPMRAFGLNKQDAIGGIVVTLWYLKVGTKSAIRLVPQRYLLEHTHCPQLPTKLVDPQSTASCPYTTSLEKHLIGVPEPRKKNTLTPLSWRGAVAMPLPSAERMWVSKLRRVRT
jgi:hypothetical protein